MAALAATTSTMTIGIAVLFAALREPVTLAKQLACIEQLAPGRLMHGIGDGWLGEELALLGVDFADRRRQVPCRRWNWHGPVCTQLTTWLASRSSLSNHDRRDPSLS